MNDALFGLVAVVAGALAVTLVMLPLISWIGGTDRPARTERDAATGFAVGAVAACAAAWLVWALLPMRGAWHDDSEKALFGAVIGLMLNAPDLAAAVRWSRRRARS